VIQPPCQYKGHLLRRPPYCTAQTGATRVVELKMANKSEYMATSFVRGTTRETLLTRYLACSGEQLISVVHCRKFCKAQLIGYFYMGFAFYLALARYVSSHLRTEFLPQKTSKQCRGLRCWCAAGVSHSELVGGKVRLTSLLTCSCLRSVIYGLVVLSARRSPFSSSS
jgi:hypothetical protein